MSLQVPTHTCVENHSISTRFDLGLNWQREKSGVLDALEFLGLECSLLHFAFDAGVVQYL